MTLFDNIGIIVKYISYIDCIMIGFTCKDLHNYIKNNIKFKDIIMRELSKNLMPHDVKTLMNFVKESDAVISGSFILALIYGETWYNDIDIYENHIYFADYIKKSSH